MKHNDDGRDAENAVADYLKSQGFKILEQNWKTRWCEIDIIALMDGCVHFVEVKYRSHRSQGSGLDYITPAKLRQMTFAAEFWIANDHKYEEYVLSAAEVSGTEFEVNFIAEV